MSRFTASASGKSASWTSRARTSICGSITRTSSCRFLVSSRGYGVLWDNLSYTRFGDLREFEPIPANCLMDVSNQPGGLTTGTFTAANPGQLAKCRTAPMKSRLQSRGGGGAGGWTRWAGELVPPDDRRLST